MSSYEKTFSVHEADGRDDYEASLGEDRHLREWASSQETDEKMGLPYAVYGTLRPTCSNARLWDGLADVGAVGTAKGYRMVTGRSMGFPFALPAPDSSIVVELLYPREGSERELRGRLDALEGYPNFYDRKIVKVETVWGFVEAWIYFVSSVRFFGELIDVPSGDWLSRMS